MIMEDQDGGRGRRIPHRIDGRGLSDWRQLGDVSFKNVDIYTPGGRYLTAAKIIRWGEGDD